MTDLVRIDAPEGGLEELRSRVRKLEQLRDERASELETMKADHERFRIRYRHEVGRLHEQLDELELAIAEAELGELSRHVEELKQQGAEETNARETPAADKPARFTSDAVRKLFREVAKIVHPDLARDQATRDRLHALMIEANRAYALGDEEQLRSILQAWERSPESVKGSDADAMRVRYARRAAQLEEQLVLMAGEIAELKDSPLGKLKAMVDQAAIQGKDLVKQMVKQLERDIMVAKNRLDAMRG